MSPPRFTLGSLVLQTQPGTEVPQCATPSCRIPPEKTTPWERGHASATGGTERAFWVRQAGMWKLCPWARDSALPTCRYDVDRWTAQGDDRVRHGLTGSAAGSVDASERFAELRSVARPKSGIVAGQHLATLERKKRSQSVADPCFADRLIRLHGCPGLAANDTALVPVGLVAWLPWWYNLATGRSRQWESTARPCRAVTKSQPQCRCRPRIFSQS